MRVLYICETIDYGVGLNVKDLVELSLADGHSVCLVWSKARSGIEFQRWIEGIQDKKFESHVIPMRRAPHPSDIAVIYKILRIAIGQGPFDVVHGFSSKGGAYARIVGAVTRTPRFYSPHAYLISSPNLSALARIFFFNLERVLNFGAYVVCISTEEIEITRRLGCRKMAFIPNGIELSGLPVRRQWSLPAKLSFVGRLSSQKDPLFFVKVAERMSHLPVEFHMFGEGALREAVERSIPQSLVGRIHLHGRVSGEQIWANTDILLSSSRYEGFPYAFIEAIARGIPVVSTNVGGADNVVEQGVTGFVYDEQSIDGAAEFVESYVVDHTSRRTITDACRDKAQRFSRQKMYKDVLAFYLGTVTPARSENAVA